MRTNCGEHNAAFIGHLGAHDAAQIDPFGTPQPKIIKKLESVPNGGSRKVGDVTAGDPPGG